MPEFARRAAEQRPDEATLTDPTRSIDWAELDVMLNRMTNAVRAVDLGPSQRVAVYAENATETALAHLDGLLGGASTVPVNFHLLADEASYVLRDSTARILFVGPETVERGLAAAAGSDVHTIVGWGLPPTPGVVPWEHWLEVPG
jgi:long-chain acyl-CoA synthetase